MGEIRIVLRQCLASRFVPLCSTIETAVIQWLRKKNITVMLLKLLKKKRLHIVNKSEH